MFFNLSFCSSLSFFSSYYDQMCGLCGDYDGNPNNDFTKPDGSQADNSDQFGNSWQTDEDEDETSVVFPLLHFINKRQCFEKIVNDGEL